MRRTRKIVLWALAALTVPAVAVAIAMLWFFHVAGPDTWTAALRMGTDAASGPDMRIEAGRFERRSDGVLVLERVSLADADGAWLTVEDVSLDIAFAPLLRGQAVIEGLTVRRIELERVPAGDDAALAEAEPFALPDRLSFPELPLDIRLRSLRVEELVLAEGTAPERTRLALDAEADYAASGQDIRLEIHPLDLGQSHLKLLFSAEAATDSLTVDITGDLPVIAPLDEALGAPDGARMQVMIQGAGRLSDAALDLALNIDGVADLVGDVRIRNTSPDGLVFRLDALANLTGGVAAEPATLVGNPVSLEAGIRLGDEERVRVEQLRIGTPWLDAALSGDLHLAEQAMNLRTRMTLRRHAGLDPYLSGATFDRLVVQGTATGPMDHIETSLTALAEKPAFRPYSASSAEIGISGVTDLESFSGKLTATLAQPRTGDEAIETLIGRSATLTAHVAANSDMAEVTEILLASAFAQAEGGFRTNLGTSTVNGALRIAVPELAMAPQLTPLLAGGNAGVTVDIDDLTPAGGNAVLALTLDGLAWKDPQMQAAIGQSFSLEGKAGLSAEGNQTADITLRSGGGIGGSLKLVTDGEQIEGAYDFAVSQIPPDLAPPALKGLRDISLKGTVGGTSAAPETKGRIGAGSLAVSGIRIGNPAIDFQATELLGNPLVRLRLGALVQGEPVRLQTAIRADLTAERVTIADTSAGYRSARIEGGATVDLATTVIDSRLKIAATDLSDFADLAGVELGGEISGTVELRPAQGRLDTRIRLTGKDIRADAASVHSIISDIAIADFLGKAPHLGGDLVLSGIAADEARIERVDIALAGDINTPAATISARVTAPEAADINLNLAASLADPEALDIRFSTLELKTGPGAINARAPFRIVLRGDTIEARGLDLASSFGGTVRGDAVYGPSRIQADLAIEALPLGPLAKIGGLDGITGEANATAKLDTAASGDKGGLKLSIDGLTLPDLPSDTPFTIQVDGAWRAGQALVEASVSGPFEQPLTAKVAGDLPFPRGSALPEVPRNGDVSGQIRWNGDLARLVALLPASDHVVNGSARIDVSLEGTWSTPRLLGAAAIGPVRYENLTSGSVLQNLTADVTFDDGGNGRFSLAGEGPEGGTVNGRGDLVLLGENRKALIEISAGRLMAFRRDEARAVISGDTRITWDGKRLDILARQVLNEVTIYLSSPDLPPSVVAIDLERDKDPEEERKKRDIPDELPVFLDVEVTSPGKFFVRGRGLESEWRGDVSVKGSAGDPQIRTNFSAIRGSLSLLGRTFNLKEGGLDLDESLNPQFRIELERETPDLTGSIIISGNPQQPDIAFTSTPELPQDEVLPRLLFDKSKQSLSPLEAVNLAQGINTLTNGKPGATDRIRDAVGLDVLRFEEADDPDSAGAVSVGRYVRDGVYVGAKKSVDSDAGSVVVEIDVLPNLKVDTEVGADGGTSTGITWEYKY